MRPRPFRIAPVVGAALLAACSLAGASSHREAPYIAGLPRVDGTDFYMFRSYEPGRANYVTLIANYLPLQDAYGGPSYFAMDPNALYEIHVDNNGDGEEDLTFQFRFQNKLAGVKLPIGGMSIPIPLQQAGPVSNPKDPNLNLGESYTVTLVRGNRRTGTAQPVTNINGAATVFDKPVDNIGTKTIPDYASYAAKHVYDVSLPGCREPARLFVGQRKDPFWLNLGAIFDLVNAPLAVITDPALIGAVPNTIDDKNVTALSLEVHKSCLTAGGDPVIGAWTTSSLRQSRLLDGNPPNGYQASEKVGGAWVQVSRLGMPLVNEVVIGLGDKDKFNASQPRGDAQFASYVTNPSFPALLELAFGQPPGAFAPSNFPRSDLVTTFLTGIKGVNQPRTVKPAEQLRLNTDIEPVPLAQQNRLGIVGNILAGGRDFAGYPNGRRPNDDIVDITLVAAMGGLCMANGANDALGFGLACNPSVVPLKETAFKLHDAVDQAKAPLLPGFPYLALPIPGAQ